ncbi:MAG TPA: UDP-N-acetylmuramoyl-L-alanine--D-glutamate ligase [Jatrophihabitans sp.]
MKIGVIGYGVEGRAAVEYWGARGEVVVHTRELKSEAPPGVSVVTGPGYLDDLDDYDLLIRSPGVRPDLLPDGVATTTVIAEFFARCPATIVGVTGTQGKGTTCTVATAILKAAGRRVQLGGNIGVVPLQFLADMTAEDIVVLELSNFQLIDLPSSPQVAVVLPITPDHLNWHSDLDEYHQAKSAIAAWQKPDDTVVFDSANEVASRIAESSPGRKIPLRSPEGVEVRDSAIYVRGERVLEVSKIPLRGKHNVDNVAAAVAATFDLISGDLAALQRGVSGLHPLPYRLEPIADVAGVTYVNDSLSTTPETTMAAMAAYPETKVLILGGSSKGVSYEALAAAVARDAGSIRTTLLIGQDGPKIAEALDATGFSNHQFVPGSMAEVVNVAARVAQSGDVVLLSPACASFGAFRDYADRGDQFVAAVRELPEA